MPTARPVSTSSSTTASARCKLLLTHSSDTKVEAVSTESVPDLVTEAAAAASVTKDLEEFAWSRAQTRISIFSAQQYVANYLTPPFQAAGYLNLNFIDARLDISTADLAKGSPVCCLFVNDDCSEKVVKKLAKNGVKMIAMRCAGFDRVDLTACATYGIKVARVPTYSPTSVAEHAVALLMALNRRLTQAYMRVQQGNYSLSPLVGSELRGKTVGVMGTGAIGVEACRIFKGIGMKVLAYDIRPNPAVEAMDIPYLSIEEILPQADVVSLHVPLLPSTYELMNKPRIEMMKEGSFLLNVSRGGLVNSDELIRGLERGQLAGIGLDVWENEGDLFFTDWSDMDMNIRMKYWDRKFKTLLSYPQVLVTPHSAFLTYEALANIGSTTVQNVTEFLSGQPLTNELQHKPVKS